MGKLKFFYLLNKIVNPVIKFLCNFDVISFDSF